MQAAEPKRENALWNAYQAVDQRLGIRCLNAPTPEQEAAVVDGLLYSIISQEQKAEDLKQKL